jgi:PKD repeat protein
VNLWPEEMLGMFSAIDRDPGDEVELTIESSNQDLLPSERIELEKLGDAWQLIGTFLRGQTGETTITVIASDGDKSASSSCVITVVAPETFTVQLTETEGGEVSLSPVSENYLEEQPIEVTAKPARGYVFQNWTGDTDATGDQFIFNISRDTKLGAVFANPGPEIVSINLPTKVYRGEAANLGAVVEDANSDEVTLAWDLGDGASASGRSVEHTYNREGTFTLTLTATDSVGQAVTENASIEVTVDRKALRFTGRFDLFGFENEPFEGKVETITPGGGQLLDLVVLKKPDWVGFTDNGDGTGEFAGTPTTADVGNQEVVMELTDGKQKVTQSYALEIIDSPEPPVIAAIADQQGVSIREIGPIVIEASDPDLDATLAYSVMSNDHNVVHPNRMRFVITEEGERHLYIVPNRDNAGAATITVTVSDGEFEAEASFTLTTPPSVCARSRL